MLVCGNQVNEILLWPGTMWLDLNLLMEQGGVINQQLGNNKTQQRPNHPGIYTPH